MNNVKTVAVIVAAGIILGLVSSVSSLALAPAQAKPNTTHVEKYMTSGKIASAHWFTEDGDTFTQGIVNLIVAAKTPEGTSESFVDVNIEQYKLEEYCEILNGEEYCDYEYTPVMTFFGYAELDRSDFNISSNLRSASLDSVEVTGFDYVNGEEKTITVDATWSDEGSPIKQRNSYSETNEYYKIFFKGMISGRTADASIEITGDINTSSGDSDFSDAFIVKAKEVVLYKIYEEPI